MDVSAVADKNRRQRLVSFLSNGYRIRFLLPYV
jgi:hypothetical protein